MVYTFLGPVGGRTEVADAEGVLVGDVRFGFLGGRLAAAGDVDGDGRADLLVGASDSTYLVYGPVTTVTSVADAGASFDRASATGYSLPGSATPGDFNGDGFDDLLIGAYTAETSPAYAGSAYVEFGSGGW